MAAAESGLTMWWRLRRALPIYFTWWRTPLRRAAPPPRQLVAQAEAGRCAWQMPAIVHSSLSAVSVIARNLNFYYVILFWHFLKHFFFTGLNKILLLLTINYLYLFGLLVRREGFWDLSLINKVPKYKKNWFLY